MVEVMTGDQATVGQKGGDVLLGTGLWGQVRYGLS
jgi:hypothetical protein